MLGATAWKHLQGHWFSYHFLQAETTVLSQNNCTIRGKAGLILAPSMHWKSSLISTVKKMKDGYAAEIMFHKLKSNVNVLFQMPNSGWHMPPTLTVRAEENSCCSNAEIFSIPKKPETVPEYVTKINMNSRWPWRVVYNMCNAFRTSHSSSSAWLETDMITFRLMLWQRGEKV